jgi:antitoxin ParD1/3/4
MNVSLTPELEKFVEERIKSGSFASASEVMRAGLRLLEEREMALGKIKTLLNQAEQDIQAGRVVRYESRKQALEDIKNRALSRKPKPSRTVGK